ncbi:MAG: hypothetical protein ACRDHK_03585 [Actinomycetota bacterium]
MTVDYEVDLASRSSSGLGAVILDDFLNTIGVPLRGGAQVKFTEVLNGYGSLEFTLPLDHASVTRANFAVGNREVHVYRDGILVWGGKLWAANVQDWFVRFLCHDWYFDLTRREVEDDYASLPASPKDQLDIVRELVDLTQAESGGDLGLTHANLTDSGVTREIVICAEERRAVADVIEELAETDDGFDFGVHPDKVLELWHPRRGSSTPVATLDAATTVSDFEYEEDASELSSQVAGIGEQEDCALPNVYVTTDAGALSTYGLLQDHVVPEDDKDPLLVEAAANELLRVSRVSRLQPKVALATDLPDALAYDAYELGDEVTLVASRGAVGGFGQFNQQFRVVSRSVEVARPGHEKVTLGLDQVVT